MSAAVTALLADQTRDEVRTKAMALVGASIGLMFALSLVAAPLLAAQIGLHGLFAVTGALALVCIAVVAWWTPPEPLQHKNMPRGRLSEVLSHAGLLRLDVGVFVLHAVQLAMWVAIPGPAGAGRPAQGAALACLPAGGAGVLRGHGRHAVPAGAARLPARRVPGRRWAWWRWCRSGCCWVAGQPGIGVLAALLFVFFCGFNVLEASQPSMASRIAPPHARGAALGVYNTLQSLGFFAGGAVGGWLIKNVGAQGLFAACAGLMLVWLVVAWPMRAPRRAELGRRSAGRRGPGDIIVLIESDG